MPSSPTAGETARRPSWGAPALPASALSAATGRHRSSRGGGERSTAHHSPGGSIGNRERTRWAGPRALPALTAQHRADPATALPGFGRTFPPRRKSEANVNQAVQPMGSRAALGSAPASASRRPRCFPQAVAALRPRSYSRLRVPLLGGWRVAAGTKARPTPRREAADRGLFCEPEVSWVNGRSARARRHFPSLDSLGRWEKGSVGKGSVGADRKRPGGWGGRAGGRAGRPAGRSQGGPRVAVVQAGDGRRVARPAGPSPLRFPPSASRTGGGVILHILQSSPSSPRCNLTWEGKSGPRSSPIGWRLLLL